MSPATTTSNDELLPLFIGITGHRDLRAEDLQPLREAVQKVLRDLRARYPDTPLIALSPLGEGADRLMAQIAIEEGMELIVPLPLPRATYESSFSSDESRAEFARFVGQARAVFTLPWIECGHANKDGVVINDNPTPAQIEGQYAAMGAYLARYSHVLLALWDGDDDPKHERTGGTAHIVRLRLHGAPPPYGPVISPLERTGYGAIHHVLTPRTSHPLPAGVAQDAFKLKVLPSENAAEDFKRIDGFNSDVKKFQGELGASAQKNASVLIAGSAPTTASSSEAQAPSISPELRTPLSIYGWSDTLSTVFSRQMTRSTKRVFGLVFLAALSFNLFHSLPHGHHGEDHGTGAHATEVHATGGHATDSYATDSHAADSHAGGASSAGAKAAGADASHGDAGGDHGSPALGSPAHDAPVASAPDGPTSGSGAPSESSADAGFSLASLWSLLPWFLWSYLVLVGVNFVLHGRTEKMELQNKYQDYRALAEGLRVQIFWRMAGLREDVSDHYLGKQRGELNWIRHAIKSCNVLADSQNHNSPRSSRENLPTVVRQWAREQRNYYVGKAHREHHELERQEKIISRLVIASVVLSLILALVLTIPALLPIAAFKSLKALVEDPLNHGLIMIAIVMLAVTAGLLHGYNTLLARAEHTKRYGRMGTLFEGATKELEAQLAAGHSHKACILLHELGREALAENGDWVLLHRERPLEVPHAG